MDKESLKFIDFDKKTSICERCGDSFGCGAKSKSCWCAEVELNSETLKRLGKNYRECLCPKCLGKFADEEVRK